MSSLNAGARSPSTDPAKGSWCKQVRQEIGPIASPDLIQVAPGLPKTRSGKIMRRILRKIDGDVLRRVIGVLVVAFVAVMAAGWR